MQKNNWFKRAVRVAGAAAIAGTIGMVSTHAAIDGSVTNIVNDTSAFIGTLFPVKATIVVAGIAFSLVKFLKGR